MSGRGNGHPAGRAALAAVLLCTAAACGRMGGDARRGPYADKVAEAIPQIESAVGVKFKRPPKVETRSREQVRQFLVQEFEQAEPQRQLAGEEAAYKLLGLLPDTLDLRRLLLAVLQEQIIGYYDPKTKVLYVVDGAPEEVAGLTITHELVHALQDQYVNLDSLQHITADADRQAAAQAVFEGQATYEGLSIAVGGRGNIAARLPGGWDQMRDLIRQDQSSQPLFAAAPMVVQEELLFPYINGAEFIRRFKDHYPHRLPFDSMPVSTEQVMHERAYFGKPRDMPIRVVLPPIAGQTFSDDLGEFTTRLVVFAQTRDAALASRAAAGWGGDRFAVARTSGGSALVWATAWDSGMDAAEFVDALGQAIGRRYRTSAPSVAPSGVRTYSGATRTVVITPREIGGTSVVLVVDVPKGTDANLVDVGKVKLEK